ncbi:hypothetical protein SAMN05421595_0677 [Austwickia chelonae]|uniref:VCBS repeat-containing protein n=1 Tax=Austwickia chelonae NBRC 105200 TaxID=1184607 RepID=K6UMI9_9MICO|nr:VCBS repeat-containing protein [Austwickia chelonae]GAB78156.1 hypothetical protein AUCHE_08_04010 [Austwickia chelonae NBRC 105200]SEV97817.1 hypothetical protein SAMN05421595_0677 [Austwickia chelonae]
MNRRSLRAAVPLGALTLLVAGLPAPTAQAEPANPDERPRILQDQGDGKGSDGLHPQWGVTPAPGQDCPANSTKLPTLIGAENFENPTSTLFEITGMTTTTGTTGHHQQHIGQVGAPDATLLRTRVLTTGHNRIYVKFDVRGDFGRREIAVAPNNASGGWVVTPAASADPPAAPDTWRTVRMDLTDGANEGAWKNDLKIQWLRKQQTASTVDIDNIEIYQCTPAPVGEPGDFNGDGFADAVFAMHGGELILGAGSPITPNSLWLGGVGWNTMTWIGSVGDTNGDRFTDLLARTSTGDLLAYYGDGVRGFTGSRKIGNGWQSMTSIIPVGDVNGDGRQDLIARDQAGTMRLYSFRTDGGLEGGKVVGSGWNSFQDVVGIRTSTKPGIPTRLYAVDAHGDLKSYTVSSSGAMTGWGKRVGNGWGFRAITSVGDFDGDGLDDILAVADDGTAYVYPTRGDGQWKPTLKIPEKIWNGAKLIG